MVFRSFKVESAILRRLTGFLASWVLEQEDYSVDGTGEGKLSTGNISG